MSGKPRLANITEQVIGGVIAGLVVSIVSQIISAGSGAAYPATIPLLIGATVLIVALVLAFLWPPLRTFLSTIGARAIALFRWLIRNWQVVLGVLLLAAVPAAMYGFTGWCWPAILTLGLEVAFLLLARYEQTLMVFSGSGVGDFSQNRTGSATPPVLCDPLFPDWIRLGGADWVWIKNHPTDQEAQQGQTVWHNVRVHMPRFVWKVRNATLYFVVDDYVNVYVNDALLRRRERGGTVIAQDVGSHLHPGKNLIEMEIENAPMPGAMWDSNLAGITFVIRIRLGVF